MKKIFLLAGLVLTACTHTPSETAREPSSTYVGYEKVRQCGTIQYTESNRNALNVEDLHYVLKTDCNRDKLISANESRKAIFIPLEQIKPQQKSWLTRWKNEAMAKENKASANPYICVQVLAKEDPCATGRSALGHRPQFSANVQSFQSKRK